MRPKFLILTACVLLSAMISSCVKDDESIDLDYSSMPVSFVVSDSQFTQTKGAQVSSTAQIPSMRIIAYDSSNEEFFNTTAMESDGSWSIYPAVVWGDVTSADFTAISPCIETSNDYGLTYSTTSEKTTIIYDTPVYSVDQPDLMAASASAAAGESVSLSFDHLLASLWFRVQGDGSGMTVTSISIKNIKNYGTLTIKDGVTSWAATCENANKAFYVSLTADANIDNLSTVASSSSYMMLIPQSVDDYTQIEVIFKSALGDSYSQKYGFPDNTQWIAGNSYTYNIFYDAEDAELYDPESENGGDGNGGNTDNGDYIVWDYTLLSSSNCYIVNPDTDNEKGVIIYIPVSERINEYHIDYENRDAATMSYFYEDWTPRMVWHDVDVDLAATFVAERVDLSSGEYGGDCTTAMKLTFPKGITEGNFVVGAYEGGVYYWSWHFWVTDYCPYGIEEANPAAGDIYVAATSDGGEVHSYTSAPAFQSGGVYEGKYMMDRNIGTRRPFYRHNGAAGSVFYQWGRKDPFPGYAGVYTDEISNKSGYDADFHIQISSSSYISILHSVQYPNQIGYGVYTSIYTNGDDKPYGYGDWCYERYAYSSDGGTYALKDILWRDPNAEYPFSSGSSSYYPDTYNGLYDDPDERIKSLYDPSPWGWCVPISYAAEDFSDDTVTSDDTMNIYRGEAYFPNEGNLYARYRYSSGTYYYYSNLSEDSSYCYAWFSDIQDNCTYNSTYKYFSLSNYHHYGSKFYATDLYIYKSSYSGDVTAKRNTISRSDALPIRCVQETSESPYELINELKNAN